MSFGQYYAYEESLSEQTHTGDTNYVEGLSLTTPSVEAGDYMIKWSFTWRCDSASYDLKAQIEEDNTDQVWEMLEEPKEIASDQRIPASGFAQRPLTAGVHTFDLDFGVTNASINGYIYNARLAFWRTD